MEFLIGGKWTLLGVKPSRHDGRWTPDDQVMPMPTGCDRLITGQELMGYVCRKVPPKNQVYVAGRGLVDRPGGSERGDGMRVSVREEYKKYVVGAVDANGTIREIVCKPRKDDPNEGLLHGYAPVELIQGDPALTAYGKRMGWTLLRDRCEKDGCPERYEEWLRVVHARVDGYAVEIDDWSTVLPPSVIEQRRKAREE